MTSGRDRSCPCVLNGVPPSSDGRLCQDCVALYEWTPETCPKAWEHYTMADCPRCGWRRS